MLTQAIRSICDNKDIKIDDFTECGNFTSMPVTKCYPIHYEDFNQLFEEQYLDEVMNTIRDYGSYFIETWNKMQSFKNKTYKLSLDANVAYIKLAQTYCPQVFAICLDYF
jgi:hypothetical protein